MHTGGAGKIHRAEVDSLLVCSVWEGWHGVSAGERKGDLQTQEGHRKKYGHDASSFPTLTLIPEWSK